MSDPLAGIPLSALRVFEAAARLQSFTRAAEELGVSQAAVSWQVKALEQRLGQKLFSRRPREVIPTSGGERLARASTEAMSLLRTALSDLTQTNEGVLVVTTLQTFAAQWLAPRLGAFQLAHPNLAVRLETTSRVVDLTCENVDVALRVGAGGWPRLLGHRLFSSAAAPLCTPGLREALGLFRPEDLLRAPRIGSEDEWAAWFAGVGASVPAQVAGPRLSGDVQAVEVASALVGQGVALACPTLFQAEITAGRLVQLFDAVDVRGPDDSYWLVYPEERRRSRKIAAFRDWLLDCAATSVSPAPVATAAG